MHVFLTLMRRELGTFFVSLTGYVIISGVALLSGLSFCVLIRQMGGSGYQLPVTELFFQSPMFWFTLLIANAVITMRLYAHEKYSGTYETLMTTPVSDLQVVSSKFAAAWVFYMIMWLPFLGCCYIRQTSRRAGYWRVAQHVHRHWIVRRVLHFIWRIRLGIDGEPDGGSDVESVDGTRFVRTELRVGTCFLKRELAGTSVEPV